ncbi:MAG: hypothetical protein NHG13_00150 [Candidatus Shikimatogenerans bostrichidophilus]|nr:MAG: hypothetical protein NHG13_00150 [Candidatus Shikimatogenerans bostrichidophilus]
MYKKYYVKGLYLKITKNIYFKIINYKKIIYDEYTNKILIDENLSNLIKTKINNYIINKEII